MNFSIANFPSFDFQVMSFKALNSYKPLAVIILMGAMTGLYTQPASAARINNPVAVFNGIDKITGNITSFDVYIGETVQFGALQVTPRVCFSRDETEKPKTTTFVEVEEITLERDIKRIFTGWMFADSPGLNAVEHAVYDIWLKECKQTSDVPAPAGLVLPDVPDPLPEQDQIDAIASQIEQGTQDLRVDDNSGLEPLSPNGQFLEELPTLDLTNSNN